MFRKQEKTDVVDVSRLTPYHLERVEQNGQLYFFLRGPNGEVLRGNREVYFSNGNGIKQVYLTWDAGVPIRAPRKDSDIFDAIRETDLIYV